MVVPILAYGSPVLRKEAKTIELSVRSLGEQVETMFETMYNAHGVGLAAPQIGQSIRLFVVDASPFAAGGEGQEEDPLAKGLEGFKKVFVNPVIEAEEGEEWAFAEGCLSIPGIREDVLRKPVITLSYYDERGAHHRDTFEGYAARIIQHEYDHLRGVLFVDHLSPLKRRLLKKKLIDISKGEAKVDYPMQFPQLKKRKK